MLKTFGDLAVDPNDVIAVSKNGNASVLLIQCSTDKGSQAAIEVSETGAAQLIAYLSETGAAQLIAYLSKNEAQ